MITVDASVWVSLFDLADPLHPPTVAFGTRLQQSREPVFAPSFVVVEIGCAVSRRCRDAGKGLAAAQALSRVPTLRLIHEDAELMAQALALGSRLFLRGADALYVALARRTETRLITWDRELVARADALTPSEWMDRNAANNRP